MQRHPAQVDVIVGLAPRRQCHAAVHDGQVVDQRQQFVAVTHRAQPIFRRLQTPGRRCVAKCNPPTPPKPVFVAFARGVNVSHGRTSS